MALIRCKECSGRKTVLGLGMIVKDCSGCKGIGFVEPQEIVEHTIEPLIIEPVVVSVEPQESEGSNTTIDSLKQMLGKKGKK